MKRLFFSIFMLLSVLLTFGQTTKKVAILETVDREQAIPYAVKLIIRSNLAKAITNTPGYEAFDRTDMDAILGEQNFQRTGMVSNEQIKRLGEMTGAAYVLVAEAVKADQRTMYIMAKLLDVETGRIEATVNQLIGSDVRQLQAGCELLSKNLLKDKVIEQEVKKEQPAKQEISAKERKAQEKQAKELKEQQDKQAKKDAKSNKKVKSVVVDKGDGKISKMENNKYSYAGELMTEKQLRLFLENNCKEAHKQYKAGSGMVGGGWATFLLSLGCIGGGLADGLLHQCGSPYYTYFDFDVTHYIKDGYYDRTQNKWIYTYYTENDTQKKEELLKHKKLTYALFGVGGALFVTSITLWSVGHKKKATAWQKYNEVCAPSASSTASTASLDLKASPNSVGLVLNF